MMDFASDTRRSIQNGLYGAHPVWIQIGISFLMGIVLLWSQGCQSPSASRQTEFLSRTAEEAHRINDAQDLGIEVKGIYLSAAGYMLDFRFYVTDPDKAAVIFGDEITNYLIDQESGARLIVPKPPKVGSLQQNSGIPRKDRTYFIMFANPGRLIQSGKKVTVVMGETEIKDMVVQ
ncbi:MAG: hypothetical protein JXA82_01170 [Sedimentisphaerales bacterium]|nr:hypothetical protein [Sedimentisphaerales bacterium]